VPSSTPLVGETRPPWASTIALTIESPSPIPGVAWVRELRKKRWNRCCFGVRDPDARVGHLEHHVRSGRGEPDRDRPAAGGELQRVREQVLEHLDDPRAVGEHDGNRLGLEDQIDADLGGLRLQPFDRLDGHGAEVDLRQVERERPRLGPRDEQEVVQ